MNLPSFLLSLAFLHSCSSAPTAVADSKHVRAYQTPTVRVVKIDELTQRFAQTGDSLIIFNFWATWCEPCVAELPYFEQINEQYASQKVRVVFVSLDKPKNIEKVLIPFLERKKIQAEVLVLDGVANDFIDKICPQWQGSIPASLFIRSDKNLRVFEERDFDYETLRKKVEGLL